MIVTRTTVGRESRNTSVVPPFFLPGRTTLRVTLTALPATRRLQCDRRGSQLLTTNGPASPAPTAPLPAAAASWCPRPRSAWARCPLLWSSSRRAPVAPAGAPRAAAAVAEAVGVVEA